MKRASLLLSFLLVVALICCTGAQPERTGKRNEQAANLNPMDQQPAKSIESGRYDSDVAGAAKAKRAEIDEKRAALQKQIDDYRIQAMKDSAMSPEEKAHLMDMHRQMSELR